MQIVQHRFRLLPALALLAACFVSVACTTTVETQSFKNTRSPNVEAAYLATDADFGKYDRLTAEDMGIFFPEDAAPSADDQQRTRQIFREAFLGELKAYQIVDEPGPTTLMVQATLVDYRNATSVNASLVRRELRDIVAPGALLFLMELKDSESGKILARAADSASAPAFSDSESGTDWTSVESAADRWAKLFRQFLEDNLNE
jgi:hypothetical protein